MPCDLCKSEGQFKAIKVCTTDFNICPWCELRVMQYMQGNANGSVANIFWGFGHVGPQDWAYIRDVIRKNDIHEILELGIGLSSELFVNEGLQLIGFDVLEPHAKMYQNLWTIGNAAKFHHYDDNGEPPVEKLYPGRTWDFVFVDGPQFRADEVRVAVRVATKFIYLHDPNLGEQSFFPTPDWEPVGGKESKLFQLTSTK